jgi:hypothetical protein
MSTSTRKKTVSFSQFSNFWVCPYKFYRDVILKEKVFEDSIHMSFGTAIHETVQAFLTAYLNISEEEARKIDLIPMFVNAFKTQVSGKGIKHTPEEFVEFVEDGKGILNEFLSPSNIKYHFPRDKWELLGIESDIREEIINNVILNGKLDILLKEKLSGDIRIVDLKTSGRGWSSNDKDDFTKISQLRIYKALYSKKYNVPLHKIHVEFIILKRKLYENCKYEQSRIQVVKPPTYQEDILQVIQEFRKFVEHCFTPQGIHNTTQKYAKIPGEKKENCKWCIYAKNGKCDQVPDII